MNCLPNYRTTDTIRVSDNILLYRSGGNLVYRNDLKGGCPGLARDSDIMVVEQFGSQVCSGDFFHLVDRSSGIRGRSEEHTSELQSLMRISYAVFCLKKKTKHTKNYRHNNKMKQ